MIKQKEGKMGIAHLCDYLRVCLINKYGGLWLDATIFCSKSISQDCFLLPFFTLKSEYISSRFISNYEWVGFCLGGWKGNVFYSFLKEAFEIYWSKEDTAIDYLFFDYLIYIARKNIPEIELLMKAVPINNPHRDDLQAAMNNTRSFIEFESIIKDDTCFYKLSWREKYLENTAEGTESIYGYFVNSLEI